VGNDSKAFLFLATVMRDGSPQVTPVWFSYDGEYLLVNTAERRTKERNMKQRPKVAMAIQDPNDPYRYLGMRGEIESFTNEGADEHINALSLRYRGKPFNFKPGEKRIIFRIQPLYFDEH
jgi:PPOX class probable F420-dependent enzyme